MNAPRQWRSLRVLTDAELVADFRDGEFPPGADIPPDAMSRRQAIGVMGATLSLAGLAACRRPEENIVPYVDMPEGLTVGVPRWYATTMTSGTSAYGLLVESHEGRPTKIEGNEQHPASLGGTSARIQSAIFDLYDPDRSRVVTKHGATANWSDFTSAWTEAAKALEAEGGAGLAVVSEPFASPTIFRLRAAFLQRWPKARWIAHAPGAALNATEGASATATVHLLDKAKVVLALDADILMSDPEMVRHTRAFAAGRRLASEHDAMNRLWVVEGVHSVTGANADHRLRLATRLVPGFVAALLGELQKQGATVAGAASGPVPPGVAPAFLTALAKDLLANRGASVVIAGRRQPPSVHAAVRALNAALGNEGQTVIHRETKDALVPVRGELRQLVDAMKAGQVSSLVVLGPNLAYDAPADLGFAEAAKKVANVVHVGLHVDETAALAAWHVPAAHFLEAWGDARSLDGTLSVVQPLIAPLFAGKSAVEIAALLAGQEKPGYDLVRETWQPVLGGDFEARWRRVLHDGLLTGAESGTAAATPAGATPPAPAASLSDDAARGSAGAANALELVFQDCPKVGAGRSANNAWLQELPDPMTKVTWDNPLLLAPATATAHDVKDGDVVRVKAGGRTLELPVFVVPGHGRRHSRGDPRLRAPRRGPRGQRRGLRHLCVAHGAGPRRRAGRDPRAHGHERAPLADPGARVDAPHGQRARGRAAARARGEPGRIPEGAGLRHGAGRGEPPALQPVEGPQLRHRAPVGHGHRPQRVHRLQRVRRWPARARTTSRSSARSRCGAGREMHWIRIDRYFTGEPDDASAVFQPVPCMHCENAPCEQVCPVAATVHDHEGLNVMVYNRCIGTRYCSNNCPYKVRRFNFFNYTKDTPRDPEDGEQPRRHGARARRDGEVHLLRAARSNRGRQEAKLAGRDMKDGDVRPPASRPARPRPSSSATCAIRRAPSCRPSRGTATTRCSPSSTRDRARPISPRSATRTLTSRAPPERPAMARRRREGARSIAAPGHAPWPARAARAAARRRSRRSTCRPEHVPPAEVPAAGRERLLLRRRHHAAARRGNGRAAVSCGTTRRSSTGMDAARAARGDESRWKPRTRSRPAAPSATRSTARPATTPGATARASSSSAATCPPPPSTRTSCGRVPTGRSSP